MVRGPNYGPKKTYIWAQIYRFMGPKMSQGKVLLKAILDREAYLSYLRVANMISETTGSTRREGVRGRKRLHQTAIQELVQCYLSRERARAHGHRAAMDLEVTTEERPTVLRTLTATISHYRKSRFAKSAVPVPFAVLDKECVRKLHPTQRPFRRMFTLEAWIRQGFIVPVTPPDSEGGYTISRVRPAHELDRCYYQLPGDLDPAGYQEYVTTWAPSQG